jgi:hypothetical protein
LGGSSINGGFLPPTSSDAKKISLAKSAFFDPRALFIVILCATTCFVVTRTLPAFLQSEVPVKHSQRSLTFAERVAYQYAIEDVYWRNRIWAKERPDAKPSLDTAMSQTRLEKKVPDYLRKSDTLEDYWQRPIRAAQDCMAKHTRQPGVLQELFAALANDPFVLAECLARPVLSERLVTSSCGYDQGFHCTARSVLAAASASYTLPMISDGPNGCIDDTWTATSTTNAADGRNVHTAVWTGSEMIVWGGAAAFPTLFNTGGKYNLSTDSWTATSITNAPAARHDHTAVWACNEMIVWGGYDGTNLVNTGGRYDSGTDSW